LEGKLGSTLHGIYLHLTKLGSRFINNSFCSWSLSWSRSSFCGDTFSRKTIYRSFLSNFLSIINFWFRLILRLARDRLE